MEKQKLMAHITNLGHFIFFCLQDTCRFFFFTRAELLEAETESCFIKRWDSLFFIFASLKIKNLIVFTKKVCALILAELQWLT